MNRQYHPESAAPTAATIADESADAAAVGLEKVRLLFRNAGIAQAIVIINATVLVFMFGGMAAPAWVLIWWSTALGVALFRYSMARSFLARNPTVTDAPVWRLRVIATTLLASAVWGVGAAIMIAVEPGASRYFVALVMAGMVAGAVPLLSSVPQAFRAYAIPVMAAIILAALADPDGNSDPMLAFVSTLFLLALLQSSRYFHDSLDRSLKLAMQMQRMAGQLESALCSAEAASTAKTNFLATMSHEIRTPLNGVLGMAQLLLTPALPEKVRLEYTSIIISSGQTLLTLLNDILDMSKIEAGKVDLEELAFAPEQLIHEIATLFTERAQAKGLRLEAVWHGSPGARFRADATRLRQMLSNLVGNAIKFTAHGFVRIEGRERNAGVDGIHLEFAITDSGIGIPADKQALLFRPFSQVDASTTREFGGTGLGLSIVCNLAQLMGGDAHVESVAGKGARFWFDIRATRIMEDDNNRQPARAEPAEAVAVATAAEPSNFILVVEDNATNRMVVEAMLKRLGFRHESVENGIEAIEHIEAGIRPDLVLMDCQMPIMDGVEATLHIRRLERERGTSRLPIIALTAGAYEEDRERCIAAGMDDFMTKPLQFRNLQATCEKWLGAPPAPPG